VSFKSTDYTLLGEDTVSQLLTSLVGYVNRCRLINIETVLKRPVYTETMSADLVKDSLALVDDLYPGVFSYREVRNGTLFLKRNKKSFCQMCDRDHDHENALVSLRYVGGSIEKKLCFVCMRDPDYKPLQLQCDEEVELPIVKTSGTPVVTLSSIEVFAAKVVRRYSFVS
jgi:hypothetical protein